MRRTVVWRIETGALVAGLILQIAPRVAWAQLAEVDPALSAAVESLIKNDPIVANDQELAQLCRQVAEATVVDPRERAAVTTEVVTMHREGVDISALVPSEVREAAREEFARLQGQMTEKLETLRTADPEKAREVELMMREGEQCMLAFEQGERYVPSQEMVAHAEGMFHEWEADAVSRGASPEFVERARTEFTMWSAGGGEMMEAMMAGGGPSQMGEFGSEPGHMPTTEQMQAMMDSGQMTPEQLQMAKDFMQHGGFEGMPQGSEGMVHGFEGGFSAAGSGFEANAPTFEQLQHDFGNFAPTEQQYHEIVQQAEQQFHEQLEQYQPENQNYDTLQQQQFDQVQPPPGGSPPPPPPEALVAIHDHDSNGSPDEYHYDTNSDGLADHAHPTPH